MEATATEDILFRFLGWLHANRKPVIVGTVVVAVAGIAIGLHSWKQGENEADANATLMSFPVGQGLRVQASDSALSELASQYPSTSAGEFAALLRAENLFDTGDYAAAQQAFNKFQSDYPSSSLLPQAGMGVAASLEAQGKIADAIQQYQKVMANNPTDVSILEPAKLTVGRLEEEQNRLDLAFMQYKDLAQSPSQNDIWAQEARQRLQLLVGAHPELLKSITAPAPNAGISPMAGSGSAAAPALSAAPASRLSASPAVHPAAPAASNQVHLLQMPSSTPAPAPKH